MWIIWCPVQTFLGQGDVCEKGTNVDRGFLRRFREAWPQVQQKLHSGQQSQQNQQATTTIITNQPASNWLNINGAVLFYNAGQPYYEFTELFTKHK